MADAVGGFVPAGDPPVVGEQSPACESFRLQSPAQAHAQETRRSTMNPTRLFAAVFCTALGFATLQAQTLKLLVWEEYLDPDVLKAFTKETGIKVVEDNFDDNEGMMAKTGTGKSGYDIVSPSDYAVQVMARRKVLAELDHAKLPNLKHLSKDFVDLYYNTGQKFAVPFTWGTSGLAYNKKKVQNPPTKWADMFDVEKLKPLKGRISILDDAREVAGSALLALGLDPNTQNKADLEKAGEILRRQKPYLAKYDSASAEDSVASGETWIAQGYSGDIATAQAENPDIGYIIPEEGVTFFVDNLCVLQESKNKEAAHKLLDYLMRPDVALANMNSMKFATTNADIKDDGIDESLKSSAALMLPPKEKRILFKDPGQEMGDAFEALFNDLKN
jgi:spermidine/putrescine-binding protein